jgi:hypothetical protein
MSKHPEVKNYQKNLDKSEENKKHYVQAEVDSDYDSSSDEEKAPSIAKSSNHPLSGKLFQRLLEQQEANMRAQKLIYKLRKEIDTEEVQTRYIKLDLNNAQVKIGELEEKARCAETELFKARVENYATRTLLVLYIFWYILTAVKLI